MNPPSHLGYALLAGACLGALITAAYRTSSAPLPPPAPAPLVISAEVPAPSIQVFVLDRECPPKPPADTAYVLGHDDDGDEDFEQKPFRELRDRLPR